MNQFITFYYMCLTLISKSVFLFRAVVLCMFWLQEIGRQEISDHILQLGVKPAWGVKARSTWSSFLLNNSFVYCRHLAADKDKSYLNPHSLNYWIQGVKWLKQLLETILLLTTLSIGWVVVGMMSWCSAWLSVWPKLHTLSPFPLRGVDLFGL